jgi:membrane fusion protein (multidrug efflux system)
MGANFYNTTHALKLDSYRTAITVTCIGLVLLAIWLAWFSFSKITIYETSSKVRLEVNNFSNPITTLVSGKVNSVNFSLAKEIKANDVLLVLDSNNENLRLKEAEAKLQSLPSQISALEKQIIALNHAKFETQQANLSAVQSVRSRQNEINSAIAFAKDNEHRLTELSNLGQMPLIETLKARTEVQKLNAGKDALESDVQKLLKETETHKHQQDAEIENLNREIARLKGEELITQTLMATLQQSIDNHTILSPVSGKIGEMIPLQVGSYVTAGDKLGSIIPYSDLKIVADFLPSSVIGRIKVGQTASMRLDAFPWAQYGTLKAKVSRVGSEIRDNQVKVEFVPETTANSMIVLQHGLPGSIEVTIEQLSPAVMVLRAAGQLMANH